MSILKKNIIGFVVLLVLPFLNFSQQRDTVVHKEKSHILVPLAEIMVLNAGVNRYNYVLRGKTWAKVSPSSWWINLKRGYMTDGDNFTANWMAHPLHGSFFYLSARTNHYNTWQSIPYLVAGSLVWEFLGESEPASSIDAYTTNLGGFYLGEVTYRLTDYIWNYPGSRRYRWLRNTSGSLLNPMGAFNRFVLGRGIPRTPLSAIPAQLTLYGGLVPFAVGSNFDFPGSGTFIAAEVQYGDMFGPGVDNLGPFDYFRLNSWVNFPTMDDGGKNSYFNLSSDAVILGKKLGDQPDDIDVVALTQHYDYIHNNVFKLGSIVLTGDWSWQRYLGTTRLTGATRLGMVIFGSGNSEMVKPVYPDIFPKFERDYIYGQGWVGEIEGMIHTRHFGTLGGNLSHFVIYSKSQPKGVENLDLMRARYLYPAGRNLIMGLQFDYYSRQASYPHNSDESVKNKQYRELRLISGYRF